MSGKKILKFPKNITLNLRSLIGGLANGIPKNALNFLSFLVNIYFPRSFPSDIWSCGGVSALLIAINITKKQRIFVIIIVCVGERPRNCRQQRRTRMEPIKCFIKHAHTRFIARRYECFLTCA